MSCPQNAPQQTPAQAAGQTTPPLPDFMANLTVLELEQSCQKLSEIIDSGQAPSLHLESLAGNNDDCVMVGHSIADDDVDFNQYAQFGSETDAHYAGLVLPLGVKMAQELKALKLATVPHGQALPTEQQTWLGQCDEQTLKEIINLVENDYQLKSSLGNIAGASGDSVAFCVGYHEESDQYEFAKFAQFGTDEQATYAALVLKQAPQMAQEILAFRQQKNS